MRGLKKLGYRSFWPAGGSMFSLVLLAQGCPFLPTGTEFPVAEVVVVAEPASFQLGATSQARATLKDAYGNVLTDIEVSWSSSNGLVATVTPNGGTTAVVTGVGAGSAMITASAEGRSGSAAVQVTSTGSPPAPVSSVVVALASSSLNAGGTTPATATLRDAAGNALNGRAVSWSSSNQAVATVSSSGGTTAVVTAVAAGSAQIIATAEGKSGSQTLTVVSTGGGGGGALVNECASPQSGWIWCDDFEQNRLSSYFEHSDPTSFNRSSSVGVGGSYGMRARFAAGQVDAGSLKLAFGRTPQAYFRPVDAGTANYRELYWRVLIRNEPTWTGGGGDKLSRATSFASSTSWAQAMIAHVWSSSSNVNVLVIDPASGTDVLGNLITTTYNDFANLRWLGAVQGTIPIFDSNHVGQWQCVEAHARLNDAGQSNAVFEMWINDQLDARKTGFNWLGSFSEYGINAVLFENHWNAGSPKEQERYFDNIVVSTQRIGCGR